MGGTYGATAVAAAAAVATLRVIKEEGLLQNAAARGGQLQAGLRAIGAKMRLQGLRGGYVRGVGEGGEFGAG